MSDWKNVQYKDGKMRTSEGGGGGGSSTFAGLDDVNFTNVQNGQVPKYNSTTQKWENADESGGGGTVTDVTLDGNSVVNGQGVAALTTPNVSDLKDANISNPSDGQTLQYNNTNHKWENVTPASGGNVDDVKVNGSSVVDANKVAQITSYKEVTQAEYNALPDSKLNDGILYAIKDSAGADGFPPLIYSDEEREVGIWRDGKPLYQRTFHVTATGNSDTNLDTNIDHFFLVGNTYYGDTDKLSEQYIGSGVTAYCYVQVLQINGVWTLRLHNMHNNTLTFWVTVRYTKTTDTPGSGTWTTQGGYAHHYSTTEQVIGTWIDGKPLYEKTYHFVETSEQTSKSYSIADLNAEIVLLEKSRIKFGANGGYGWQVVPSWYENNQYNMCISAAPANIVIIVNGWKFLESIITIRYTKTTD